MSFIIAIATIMTAGGGLGSALTATRVEQSRSPDKLQPLPTLVNLAPTAASLLPPASTLAPPPSPPPVAEPVVALDIAIRDMPQGVAAAEAGQVACDGPGIMCLQTVGGTLLVGISQDGGWSC